MPSQPVYNVMSRGTYKSEKNMKNINFLDSFIKYIFYYLFIFYKKALTREVAETNIYVF